MPTYETFFWSQEACVRASGQNMLQRVNFKKENSKSLSLKDDLQMGLYMSALTFI